MKTLTMRNCSPKTHNAYPQKFVSVEEYVFMTKGRNSTLTLSKMRYIQMVEPAKTKEMRLYSQEDGGKEVINIDNNVNKGLRVNVG